MKKKELEERIKGLEGLIKGQRNTIRHLSDKNRELFDKLWKQETEEKTKYLINICTRDIDDYFRIDLSKKEYESVKDFIYHVNNCTGAELRIYREYSDEQLKYIQEGEERERQKYKEEMEKQNSEK